MTDESLIERLRRLTQEAQARRRSEEEERRLHEQKQAKAIIATIPEVTEREANDGKCFAPIMEVTYEGKVDVREDSGFTLDPAQLTGASALVFSYCAQAQLQPILVPHWTSLDTDMHRVDFTLCVQW